MLRTHRQALMLGTVVLTIVSACAKGDKPADTTRADSSAGMAAAPAPAAPTPAAASGTGIVDPGTASAADLVALGVSDSAAAAVVAGRPYTSMVGVDKVLAKTMSEARRDSVYARLWIPIDLNKASKEEILLIPGVGAKMLHEFEEYRPYKSIEQFRREIGKYVDKAELARLEQYVTIK